MYFNCDLEKNFGEKFRSKEGHPLEMCIPPEGANIFEKSSQVRLRVNFLSAFLYCSLMRSSLSSLQTKKEHLYTWRIELAKTEKYWDGWFRGLSNLFLSCPTPKLLLLAGTCLSRPSVDSVAVRFGDVSLLILNVNV